MACNRAGGSPVTANYPKGTAAAAGLMSCHVCGTVQQQKQGQHRNHKHYCDLCGKSLHFRKPYSLQRCLAFLITACVLYVPANLLPIMRTISIGEVTDSTIIGGALLLWNNGEYPISIVIFVASVAVPLLKIFAIGLLCWRVSVNRPSSAKHLHRLYEMTEVIGKWSMVDVFVVALLAALIQFGSVLAVQAGPAALSFAGVVMFTMLAARAFDSRLIWDKESMSTETNI